MGALGASDEVFENVPEPSNPDAKGGLPACARREPTPHPARRTMPRHRGVQGTGTRGCAGPHCSTELGPLRPKR